MLRHSAKEPDQWWRVAKFWECVARNEAHHAWSVLYSSKSTCEEKTYRRAAAAIAEKSQMKRERETEVYLSIQTCTHTHTSASKIHRFILHYYYFHYDVCKDAKSHIETRHSTMDAEKYCNYTRAFTWCTHKYAPNRKHWNEFSSSHLLLLLLLLYSRDFFFTASAPFFLPFIQSQPSQIYAYGWDFVLLFLMFMLIYIHKYKVQVCNTEYNNRNIFLFIYMSIYIVYIWKHCPIILSPFYFAWVARKSHFFYIFFFCMCAQNFLFSLAADSALFFSWLRAIYSVYYT